MTYYNYEFSAFAEADLTSGNVGCGTTFTMPASATVCITVTDNDPYLSGDGCHNENADDHYGQHASIEGPGGAELGNGGQIYAESWYWVYDQHGNWFKLIEIEQEGGSGDYFTFLGDTPDAGAQLTVHSKCNVSSNWIDYNCLDAGEKGPATGMIEGTVWCDLDCDGLQGTKLLSYKGEDLVYNGDFDCGVHGWSTSGAAHQTIAAYGDHSVLMLGGGSNGGGSIAQHIATMAGETYCVEFDGGLYSCGGAGGVLKVIVDGVVIATIDDDTSNGLDHYSFEFTAATSGSDIKFEYAGNTAHTDFDIDNIEVRQVIEEEVSALDVDLNALKAESNYSTCFVTIDITNDSDCTYELFWVDYHGNLVSYGTIEPGETKHQGTYNTHNWVLKDADSGEIIAVIEEPFDGQSVTISGDMEPTKADVEVKLIDAATGDVVDTTTTDADGNYAFADVPEGDYKIMGVAPDGTEFTIQDAGNNDNIDSDVDENGMSGTVTVTAGGTVDVDLGLCEKETGSIGGRYFCDENGDGVDNDADSDGQGDEAAVAGKTVTLFKSDGTFVAETTTDANGEYCFEDIEEGDYYVAFEGEAGKGFVADSQDPSDANDSDVDGANGAGTTSTFSLAAGEEKKDVDAGVEDLPGSLSGQYFCDENDNDIRDAGDSPIEGVLVTAFDAGGDEVGAALTEADGTYSITGLPAGEYSVVFTDPGNVLEGKALVNPNAGPDDVDSDAIGDTDLATIENITVVAGQDTPNNDAGAEALPGSLSGRYFCDEDRSDTETTGDTGVEGIVVELLDENGNGTGITTETDANGDYSFTGLDAGTYGVEFTDPTGANDGKELVTPEQGGDDAVDSDAIGDAGTSRIEGITVVAGENTPDNDAGVVELPGSLSGRYFCDDNRDGLDNDGTDNGVGGVTVELLDSNGDPATDIDGNAIGSVSTNADGSYSFGNLAAGDYSVKFTDTVSGKELTTQDVDGNASDDIDSDAGDLGGNMSQIDGITVVAGENTPDNDAGVVPALPGSLSGRYFCDDNGDGLDNDGLFGSASIGVENVTVELLDANGDPAVDADGVLVASKQTNADGSYSFANLAAGTYSVKFTDTVSGKELTTQDVDGNASDAIDSDAGDLGGNMSQIDGIVVVAGADTPDNDAGVVAPIPAEDDMAMTCSDETVAVDVLSNDGAGEGGPVGLTITSVDGQAITEGGSVTTSMGTIVTLTGGELVIDASDSFAFLDIGEEGQEVISYHFSDGLRTGEAVVTVTVCGDANSAESLDAALKAANTSVTFNLPNTATLADFVEGYTLDLQTSTNPDIPLGDYTAAYCLDNEQPIFFDTLTTADVCILTEDNLAAVAPTVDATRFDSVNWLLNQDFASQDNGDGNGLNFTDFEVQEAIWLLLNGDNGFLNQFAVPELTDNNNGVRDGAEIGTFENAQQIADLAAAAGDGFVAGDGDIIGLILEPTNPSQQDQPFVIGVNFDDIDCLC